MKQYKKIVNKTNTLTLSDGTYYMIWLFLSTPLRQYPVFEWFNYWQVIQTSFAFLTLKRYTNILLILPQMLSIKNQREGHDNLIFFVLKQKFWSIHPLFFYFGDTDNAFWIFISTHKYHD